MYSNAASGDEIFRGSARGNISTVLPFTAIQPMPALSGISVYGSAEIDVTNGSGSCTVSTALAAQSVDVISGMDSDVSWHVDVTNTDCTTGVLEGKVTLPGAPYAWQKHLSVYGPRYRYTTSFASDGSYSIDNLLPYNRYRPSLRADWSGPFGGHTIFPNVSGDVVVTGGNTTVLDIEHKVGRIRGKLNTDGPWRLADLDSQSSYSRMSWAGNGGAYGPVGYTPKLYSYQRDIGEFNLVGAEGNWWATSVDLNKRDFSSSPTTNSTITLGYHWGDLLDATPVVSGEDTNATVSMKTSQTLVALELSDALKDEGATINKITYSGTAVNPQDYSYVSLWETNLSNFPTAENIQLVKIRGVPGTYQMTATAYHTGTGGSASSSFLMTLSEPVSVDIINDAPVETFTDPTGDSIGTLDFGEITGAGSTTFSELTIGPDPEEGFSVFMPPVVDENGDPVVDENGDPVPGPAQYFDISSSATFTGEVQVCVQYDGTNLTDGEESVLRMGHYVNNAWEDITETTYPHIDTDTLCGVTDSFSYFAILVSPDSDNDGVDNADDNCPITPNEDQADADGDGTGDACELDDDGDSIINDLDLCPALQTLENGDIDEDGVGDPCDDDKDGDTVLNEDDNCPTIHNEGQADFDGDGEGDACDRDDDGDNVIDELDKCPGTGNGEAVLFTEGDDAGCTSSQRFSLNCSADGDYRNHGAYVNCVVDEADRQVDTGMLLIFCRPPNPEAQHQSDIGKK